MDMRRKIGQALKQARTDKGYSLRELARLTGLSHSFLNDIEHGRSMPSINNLVKLSSTLGVSPDFFISSDTAINVQNIASEVSNA